MSKEILSDTAREFIAGSLDKACTACQKTNTQDLVVYWRGTVGSFLQSLNTMYHLKGHDTSVYLKAYLQACEDCFNDGRRGKITNTYTCGIRAKTWKEN